MTTIAGQQVPGEAAQAAADSEAVLLTGAEADATTGASGMTADTTKSTLVDDSAYTAAVIGTEHVGECRGAEVWSLQS